MEIIKTKGVILSANSSGESDIICRILTEDCGKRSFIFKGLAKSKNRNKAAAEPGAIAHLVYYYHPEKTAHIVNEFSTYKYYPSIRDHLDKILNLYFILEIVDKTTGFDEHNVMLYSLLSLGIEALASTGHADFFSAFFIIHLLKYHGILPSFASCKLCGSSAAGAFFFDSSDLHIICDRCDKKRSIFTNSTRQFIKQALSVKFSAMDFSVFNHDEILQLLYSLHLFIESYYQVKIKSGRFVYATASLV